MRRNIVFIVCAISLFAIGECGLWDLFKKNILRVPEIRRRLPNLIANSNSSQLARYSDSIGEYTRHELIRALHLNLAELDAMAQLDYLDDQNLQRFIDVSILIQLIIGNLYRIGVPIIEWGLSYQDEENYNIFYQLICSEQEDLMEILSAEPPPGQFLLPGPSTKPALEYPTAENQHEVNKSKEETQPRESKTENATESITTDTKIKTTTTKTTTTTESKGDLDWNQCRRRGSSHVDEPSASGVTGVVPQREHRPRSRHHSSLRPISEDSDTKSQSSTRDIKDIKLTASSVGSSGIPYEKSTQQGEGRSEKMEISSSDTKDRKETGEGRKRNSHRRVSSSFEKERKSTEKQSHAPGKPPRSKTPHQKSRREKQPISPGQSVDRPQNDHSDGGSWNSAKSGSRGTSVITDASEETSTAGTESVRSKKKSHSGSRQQINSRTEEILKKTSYNLDSSFPHSLSFKSSDSQPIASENFPHREPLLSKSKLKKTRSADRSVSMSTSTTSDIGNRKMNSKMTNFLIVPADTSVTEGSSFRIGSGRRSEDFLLMPVKSTSEATFYESAEESFNTENDETAPLLQSRSRATSDERPHGEKKATSEKSTGSKKSTKKIPTNNSQNEDEQVGSLEEVESSFSDSRERTNNKRIEAEDSQATLYTNIETSVLPENVQSSVSEEAESNIIRTLSKKLSELMDENKRLKSRLSRSSSSSKSSDLGNVRNDSKSK